MSTIEAAAPRFLPDLAGADIRSITDAELDAVEGGIFPILIGIAAFSTGFFAGYGAVRFVQDVS
jgi:lactobin A/cerein 7B family class IIb bacteriocin